MSIELEKAIKTRWTAKNLAAVVANGPFFGRLPEQYTGSFPYCIVTIVSNVQTARTPATRYLDKQIQFQVYDEDNISVSNQCDAIVDAFLSADRALTSPFTATGLAVIDVRIVGDPVVEQESDGVHTGTFTIGIQYAKSSGLTPG